MTRERSNAAQEIRQALSDPRWLCERLGLAPGNAKRQARGYLVCCPAHGEKDPSCSVTTGPDGTVRAVCFSCGWKGDALALIAAVYDMETRGQRFVELLITAAELGGLTELAASLQQGTDYTPPERPAPAARPVQPEPTYPDSAELARVWEAAVPVTRDAETVAMLRRRELDPEGIAELDLARVLPPGANLPRWASYRGDSDHARSWLVTGHRLVLPAYDVDGALRSLRAWRISENDTPKRLPPAGHKTAELVLANQETLDWLRHSEALPYLAAPLQLIVTEGEPDYLVRATLNPHNAVVGVLSGSWHRGFADKIPGFSEVYLYTHRDRAGDNYARAVAETIGAWIPVHRIERTHNAA